MRRLVLPLILVAGLLAVPAASSAAPSAPNAVPGSYIVQFQKDFNGSAQGALARGLGISMQFQYSAAMNGFAAQLNDGQLRALSNNKNVLKISPDYVMTADETYYTQPNATWGLSRIDQVSLPVGSDFTYPASAGTGVEVFVIDTGINASHTEFTGRVNSGYSAINDGRGTNDCNGHGTHVSGTIAGTTWGIAKNATITPVRVLGCTGSGTLSGLIAGINWIINNHDASKTAVANMSLGFNGVVPDLQTPLNNLKADGVFAAVAAGNSSADACNYSPANFSSVFAVGASDSSDKQASFSNYGSCVELFAPGVTIRSADYRNVTGSTTMSGTSMASPHVAGVAATLLGQGNVSVDSLTAAVLTGSTATMASVTAGTTTKLLTLLPEAGATPTILAKPTVGTVSASGNKTTATLTWSTTSTSPVVYQTIYAYAGTSTKPQTFTTSATAATATITGLKSGTSYRFAVSATNAVDTSDLSYATTVVVASR